MLEYIFKNKSEKNMGSTTNIDATIISEKSLICQRLEGKHTALQIVLDVGCVCYTRVAQIA
jgi:hypothetical protein